MYQVSLQDKLPYDKFKNYLEEGSSIYVKEKELYDGIKHAEALLASREKQVKACLYGVLNMKFLSIRKQSVIDAMIELGVPEQYFCKRGSHEPIYYNQKTRDKIIANGYTNELFYLYDDYSTIRNEISMIDNVLTRTRHNKRGIDNDGETIIEVPYNVVPVQNLRFVTKEENTIGFYGKLREAFVAPEDYYILSCDFPQIDARAVVNLYLRNNKLDEIMDQVDDTYLVFKEFSRYIKNEKNKLNLEKALQQPYYTDTTELENEINSYNPSVIPFNSKAARDIYKVTALKTAYYGRYSTFSEENKKMRELTDMYNAAERYKRIEAMTHLLFSNNVPIYTRSRWGHKQLIVENTRDQVMAKVFNTPAQTTSSEAIIFYIVHFLDYFRDKGHGPEDVRMCLNRHDEPVLYIKKSVYREHIRFIASMRTYLIEGWNPIDLDIFVGNSYKKNDSEAIEMLNSLPRKTETAKLKAVKFRSQTEPYSLVEPHFIFAESRKFKDGKMRVVFIWHDGELSENLNLENLYEDRRKMKVSIMPFTTDKKYIDSDQLKQVTQVLSNRFDDQTDFLVMSPYSSNDSVSFENRVAHFRSFSNSKEQLIAQGILAKIAMDLGEECTENDKKYASYAESFKGELENAGA